jgi:hypothetical protein
MSSTLYDTDFAQWAEQTAGLMRAGRLEDVDLEHAAKEIESLRRSERRTLHSQLERVVAHLLKIRYQPEFYAKNSKSWDATLRDGRRQVWKTLADSPA